MAAAMANGAWAFGCQKSHGLQGPECDWVCSRLLDSHSQRAGAFRPKYPSLLVVLAGTLAAQIQQLCRYLAVLHHETALMRAGSSCRFL